MSEKFTYRRKNAILRKMREGHYAKTAAETSGITEQTLYNWLKKGEDPGQYPEHAVFLEAYRKAEATAEEKAIKAIQHAFPDDWRAAMTYLEAVMNLAEKPHQDADSGVSSVHRRLPFSAFASHS